MRAGVLYAAWLAMSPFGELGLGIALIAAFALEWLDPVLFEVLNHGATPGKGLRAAGTVVVYDPRPRPPCRRSRHCPRPGRCVLPSSMP